MDKKNIWGIIIIGYSIIIGILILTKVLEGTIGGGIFFGGLIILIGIRKCWLKEKQKNQEVS